MDTFKHLCKSLGKGLIWLFLSALFGLIQMWIVLLNDFMSVESTSILDKIISQGFLVFFCSGITISMAIDFHLSDKKESSKNLEKILYFLYPFVMFILVTFIGTKFEISENGTINISSAKLLQTIIVFMTIIYALVIKTRDYFIYFLMKSAK
jgi:hypothetical protein